MKLKTKIIVFISCLAVLVSSFCISSFAYSNSNDNFFNRFPSASFVAYNSNGTIKSSSCTVRSSSTNTGDSSSSVRSVWSRSTVDDIRNVSLIFGSYNSSALAITDFYYPIYISRNQGDISIDVANYVTLSGSYGVDRAYSYDNIYVKIGFYYFEVGDEPVYYERQVVVQSVPDYDPGYSADPISVYNMIDFEFGFDPSSYCLVNYIYISGSNLFIYDDGINEPVNGAFAGSVQFFDTDSFWLGTDANLNIQYGNSQLGYGFSTNGYYQGYEAGYNRGYELGYQEGYDAGLSEGEYTGYEEGYNNGSEFGYNLGYDDGYDVGFQDGYDDGKLVGEGEGYWVGYDDGLIAGGELVQPSNWLDGIFDAVSSFLNADIFGDFSIGMFITIILGFSTFMWILKIFAGG